MDQGSPIPPTPTPDDYAREAEEQAIRTARRTEGRAAEAFGVADDQGDVLSGDDPFALLSDWLRLAGQHEPNDPNAMSLATIDADGMPDVRVVLLKDLEPEADGKPGGLTFYSNAESEKGRQLAAHPRAAVAFHWKTIRRQVRVRGAVEPVEAAVADAYFASRSRGAQIGAWASQQSRRMDAPGRLAARVSDYEAIYEGRDVPRPDFWGGYRLVPERFEFWVNRPYRLHDRKRFERRDDGWATEILYP